MEDALNIYTDGSSFQHPRRGGMGIRYVIVNSDGHELLRDEVPLGYKQATNNEMELLACVLALRGIPSEFVTSAVQRIVIFTDSKYVVDNFRNAVWSWPRQKWCSAEGWPIENVDIWKQLVREVQKAPLRVNFTWVKGHSKNMHNKAVDKLAKQSANGFLNEPLKIISVRRKKSKQSVSIGSVRIEGQELDIRIITDNHMRRQKLWKYKYEVLAGDSPYAGCVDLIFSKLLLRAGRSYRVIVGENQKRPEIVEIIQEFEDGADAKSEE